MIDKLKEDKSIQITKNKKDIEKHEEFLKKYKQEIKDYSDKNHVLSESISDQENVRKKVNTLSDYGRGIEKKYNEI